MIRRQRGGRASDEGASIILIDENLVPEAERADLVEINAQLQAVAARRKDRIDHFDHPYRLSIIALKVAELSNALTYRFISLAEGVALSWNNSNALSTLLNARAIVETTAIYWDFGRQLSKLADALDFDAVNSLAMNYLFSTRDAELLEETPELKARQVLNAIDLIDETLIPHFRSHYERLSEFCHPNSLGHRGLFSKLDRETGITEYGSSALEDFIIPVKAALGTASIFDHSSVQIEKQMEAFALAHHTAHPSPLAE